MDKRVSVPSQKVDWSWILKMAWRDARKSKSRLLLFISSIVIGIATLVAINSSSDNLQNDINNHSKELLGADLKLASRDSSFSYPAIEALAHEVSYENSFKSMAFFPKNQESILVAVKALEGKFPYYGKIETKPTNAETTFRDGTPKALVDKTVLIQHNVKVGDAIKIGQVTFKIEGELISSPSQSIQSLLEEPLVYIPMAYFKKTGLIKYGSRVSYARLYKFIDPPKGFDIDEKLIEKYSDIKLFRIAKTTVKRTRASISRTFEYMTGYLNLVAFIALLLGCVGVASAVNVYVKEKIKHVAILRCLGASSKDAFFIYITQIGVLGLFGSILGALAGVLIQTILPKVFSEFLPVEVTFSLSWTSILGGILTGLFMTVLFALSSLLPIRKVSPLVVLRAIKNDKRKSINMAQLIIYASILLFTVCFAFILTGVLKDSLFFTLFIVLAFGILVLIANTSMWLIKRFFPSAWSYIWRQSLANLYRPNNQTLVLISSIGLGTALITMLYFTQALLISDVEVTRNADLPNMMIFNIQSHQIEAITELAKESGLPAMQSIPVVTMRLKSINGVDYDRETKDPFGLLEELRVTYRDSLIAFEELASGVLNINESKPDWVNDVGKDAILVSIEKGLADFFELNLGDTLIWNVQGTPISSIVGSTRTVERDRIQRSFKAVFPTGVLEQAPQFHVFLTQVKNTKERALFQRDVVKAFPNVSVSNFDPALNRLKYILEKVSFVIRFMALISIFTGLIVLISSVILSKFQRIKESVLLRTMGASRRQILSINSLEYFFLGSLGSLSGILLGILGSWGVAYYYFDSTFTPNLLPVLIVYGTITGLTILFGLLNSREIINKPPLETLRNEVQ